MTFFANNLNVVTLINAAVLYFNNVMRFKRHHWLKCLEQLAAAQASPAIVAHMLRHQLKSIAVNLATWCFQLAWLSNPHVPMGGAVNLAVVLSVGPKPKQRLMPTFRAGLGFHRRLRSEP